MAHEPLSTPRPQGLPDIPGYELEAVVGRGATGVVYRARQLAVDRTVALKVLHRELAGKGQAIRRLQREARTTARLAHPSIISAIDMGQSNGLWWYAMEYVEGHSLAETLAEKGQLSERECLRIFIPLCEALQHAHEQGVVHRDIKPANVLIDRDGRPHLVDLGLAFTENDPAITKTGGTLGTPHYISPEQARNPQSADIKSDIWSLGATMYHCLCGRPPFTGESVAEILSSVLYARVEDPEELAPKASEGLALVLRKCLSRAGERRYQSPKELADDLELLRERREVAIKRSSLDPVRAKPAPPWRRWVLGAAGGLLVLLTTWLLLQGGAADPDDPATRPSLAERSSELERVRGEAQRGRTAIAAAMVELQRLKPLVSEHHAAHYDEVLREIYGQWRTAVDEAAREFELEFERLLGERHFARAAMLLDARRVQEFGESRLRPVSDEQRLELNDRFGRAEKQRRLDLILTQETTRVEEQLERFVREEIETQVAALLARGAWKSARDELEFQIAEGLAKVPALAAELPDEIQNRLQLDYSGELSRRRRILEEDWKALDLELAEWLRRRAGEIERAIVERRQREDADRELVSDFEVELARRKLARDEMLPDHAHESLSALTRWSAALVESQRAIDETDAAVWIRENTQDSFDLWKVRDYAGVRRAWLGGRDSRLYPHLRTRLESTIRSAELCESLLARAAARLVELDGRQDALLLGTIETVGTFRAGGDPLRRGFGFRPVGASAKELDLALVPLEASKSQVLTTDALERLAGLGGNPAELATGEERLMRAVFRFREGDAVGALATLRSGSLPRETEPGLVDEMERLVGQTEHALELEEEQRETDARELYNLILRGETDQDVSATLRKIDRLLSDYGSLEWVRTRQVELRALRDRLSRPRSAPDAAGLARLFPGAEVEVAGDRARLGFEFGAGEPRAFESGSWSRQAGGWRADGTKSRQDLFQLAPWPRIELGPPLDLEGRLELELEFDQPANQPPQLVTFSCAGWHVALATGARADLRGRWWAKSGGDEALRECVDTVLTGGGKAFDGLRAGTSVRLTWRVAQARGRGELFVDGKAIGAFIDVRPDGAQGELVLRSLEIVHLRRVQIDAALK